MEKVKAVHSITGEVMTGWSRGAIAYYNGVFINGYVHPDEIRTVFAITDSGKFTIKIVFECFKDSCFWSSQHNTFVLYLGGSKLELISLKYKKISGFPYRFGKTYEAADHFSIFDGKQSIKNKYDFPLSKVLKYTFGLEFETCVGIIPEEFCFRDGLVPLRDGSISGNEYSTVVLRGNDGLNLLYQQLQTLRSYTHFNKECSLHMHFGGFPLNPDKIYKLYTTCLNIEKDLQIILPEYTFYTSKYKASGKDYCAKLHNYPDFTSLYYGLVGTDYSGSLTKPHPNDKTRGHKWNVLTRYYWLNLINLVCYSNHKTVEFRFLRPTYNLERILFWIYTFNAILMYAESELTLNDNSINLCNIFSSVYSSEIADMLEEEYYKQYMVTKQQKELYSDKIGAVTEIENDFFGFDNII